MNTIKFKGSFIRTKNFMEGGEKLFGNNTYNNILSRYLNYLKSLDQTYNTLRHKITNVSLFIQYLEENNIVNLKKLKKENVYNYIQLYDNYDHVLSYKDRNKLDIRLFLNWTFANHYSKYSGDMILPKIIWHRRTTIRTYYTKDEITKLLDVIDRRTKKGKEDYLIVSLICYLGLRISDVIYLKINDIDFNENTISIVQNKTNNELFLPLIEQIKYPLLDYLKNVRPRETESNYIFVTQKMPYEHNIKLTFHNYMIRRYFIKAGVDINGRKAGFHALRHSFSSMLLSEDVPLYSISKILGHNKVDTTMLYLDIDTSKLKMLALEVPYVK
jgi:integrase